MAETDQLFVLLASAEDSLGRAMIVPDIPSLIEQYIDARLREIAIPRPSPTPELQNLRSEILRLVDLRQRAPNQVPTQALRAARDAYVGAAILHAKGVRDAREAEVARELARIAALPPVPFSVPAPSGRPPRGGPATPPLRDGPRWAEIPGGLPAEPPPPGGSPPPTPSPPIALPIALPIGDPDRSAGPSSFATLRDLALVLSPLAVYALMKRRPSLRRVKV